jgi:methyl-coenzyme M reductase subunit D
MDIEIFPHRLLSADTTESLLNALDEIEGVKKIVLQGQRLPSEATNPDRKKINIKGEEIDLQIKTGRVLMEIDNEETIEEVRLKCEDNLHFGFNIHVGTFIRKHKTVSDQLKYGEALCDIPEDMVGLTDQNALLTERAAILKRKEEE